MQVLSSKDNPKVKQYVKLTSSKQARKKSGLFTIEGVRLCEEACRNGVKLVSCFITQRCSEMNPALFLRLQELCDDCMFITEELERKISDTTTPQGIFCICRMMEPLLWKQLLEKKQLVALCDLQDPGNLGTIIRTADAFGYEAVVLSKQCCDWYSPKVLRSAMGSAFRVGYYIADDFLALTQHFHEADKVTAAAVVNDADIVLGCCNLPEIHVVYIGNEGNGLPEEVAKACHYRLTIHMNGNTESLNASVAAAVLMWELSKKQ